MSATRPQHELDPVATAALEIPVPPLPGRVLTQVLRVALVVIVLGLLFVFGEQMAEFLPQLEAIMSELGGWGPVLLITLMVVFTPLLVPASLFGTAAGLAFGLLPGTLFYFAGGYLTSVMLFFLSRRELSGWVNRTLATRPKLRAIQEAAGFEGAGFVALLRLAPINAALVSYVLGTTDLSWRKYLLGSLALLPGMFPTVYFGSTAVQLAREATPAGGGWSPLDLAQVAGLGACLVMAIWVARVAQRAVHRAEKDATIQISRRAVQRLVRQG